VKILNRNRVQSPAQSTEFDGLVQIGGHVALDFLNTVEYRGREADGDRLAQFSDIRRWARDARLLDPGEARSLEGLDDASEIARTLRNDICRFRERARLLFPGGKTSAGRIATARTAVARRIAALRPEVSIDPETGVLKRRIPVREPRDLQERIVAAMAALLEERSDLTIKTCGGSDCDWLFIDRTKAKRRQWCDSRTCGNLARVRRHRAAMALKAENRDSGE